MTHFIRLISIALMLMSPALALAGPGEDANAAVDRWSVAFSANDPETIASNYWPDAILLGTVSPVMSEGTQSIIKYFTPTKGTGNKNAIGERRTIIINDSAVVVTGFYTFTRTDFQQRIASVPTFPLNGVSSELLPACYPGATQIWIHGHVATIRPLALSGRYWRQILWVDPSAKPTIRDIGPALKNMSLREFVEAKTYHLAYEKRPSPPKATISARRQFRTTLEKAALVRAKHYL